MLGRQKKGKPLIGLDFGSNGVRALQMARDGDRWVAVDAGWRALPARTLDDADRSDAQCEAVLSLLKEGSFVGRRVVSSLPTHAVQYNNLRLPSMPPPELQAAVEFEASDRLQLGFEHQIQYYDAGEVRQGDSTRQEVILVAALNEQIAQHMAVLDRCGLDPVAIDAVPGALARALAGSGSPSSVETKPKVENETNPAVQFILDIGHSTSKVLISMQGRVLFFKTIPIGVHSLDEAAADKLNVSIVDAAELRRQRVMAGAESDAAVVGVSRRENIDGALSNVHRPLLSDLAREIGLCLRYYSVTFRGNRPESLIVSGGGCDDSLVSEVISTESQIRVSEGDVYHHLDFSNLQTKLVTDTPKGAWAVSAGLSMRTEIGKGTNAKGAA